MSNTSDKRRIGFFQVDNEVISHYGPHIGPIGIAIYSCIAMHAGQKGSYILRVNSIAESIGVSQSSVKKWMKTLSGEDGVLSSASLSPLIEVIDRKRAVDDGIERLPNEYVLLHVDKEQVWSSENGVGRQKTDPGSSKNQGGSSEVSINNTQLQDDELQDNCSPDPESPFEDFWEAYPRSANPGRHTKKLAKARFEKAAKQVGADKIMKTLEWQKGQADWLKDGGQFIPGAQVWLNREPWESIDFETARPAETNVSPLSAEETEWARNHQFVPAFGHGWVERELERRKREQQEMDGLL